MATKADINAKWELRQGDIFDQTDIDIIIHQCNCCHCMGGGVAAAIAALYPEACQADKDKTPYKSYDKYGTNLHVKITDPKDNVKVIVNMYSQFYPGAYFNKFDYYSRLLAMEHCLKDIVDTYKDQEVTIGVPYLIGCGISGLREEDVLDVFLKTVPSNQEMTCKFVFVEYR